MLSPLFVWHPLFQSDCWYYCNNNNNIRRMFEVTAAFFWGRRVRRLLFSSVLLLLWNECCMGYIPRTRPSTTTTRLPPQRPHDRRRRTILLKRMRSSPTETTTPAQFSSISNHMYPIGSPLFLVSQHSFRRRRRRHDHSLSSSSSFSSTIAATTDASSTTTTIRKPRRCRTRLSLLSTTLSSLDSDCDPSTNSNNHNKNDEVVQNDLDDNDVKEDDDRTATAALLSYLPDGGQSLPPQIQALVARVTHFYVYGTPLLPSPSATAAEASISSFPSFSSVKSLEDISALIEVEHRSKDVPVVIGHDDDDDNLVLDVTATGEDLDETVAKVLSLAAFYRLPQPIALELLLQFPPTGLSTLENPSIWNELVATFAASGWEAVSFPHGLAIRPRTKFRWSMDITNNNSDISNSSSNIEKSNRQGQRRARLSWWHRTRTLQAEAELAVQAAAAAPAPPQQHPRTPLLKPLEFLQTMEAQLLLLRPEKEELSSDTAKQLRRSRSSTAAPDATEIMLFNDDSANSQLSTVSSTAATTAAAAPTMTALSQLFFPHNKHENIGVFRRMRRLVSKQYSALKRQGRAGFVAYCCFNCLYYTVGILWQWPRMAAIGDPLTSNLSVATLVARKFGTVFAYLYALSQLAKIPKLFTSVALAPLAGRGLELLQKRLRINETAATIVMVGATVVLWFAVISLPVFSEYATLQRIVRLDEQLVQVYGLQPV